jgi:PKD repeat protein
VDSTVQNPSFTYDTAGTYTVKLSVTGPGGSDEELKTGYIKVRLKKVPDADFIGSPTSGKVPLEVKFEDRSTNNPDIWSWDFGDLGTSSEQNPVHRYEKAGKYTVKLTVSNADGSDTETKENYITVSAEGKRLDARFIAYPRQGTAPLTVLFLDLSQGNPSSRLWDFGDGTSSTDRFVFHTYQSAGKFTVKLSVSNDAGTDTLTRVNYITVNPEKPPRAQFIAYPTEGNAPLSVFFLDLSQGNPSSRLWDFGDGSTSTDRFPTHTYVDPGRYTVKLTVSNSGGSDTMTRVNYVTVRGTRPPSARFTASPLEGTAPLTVTFHDVSRGSPTSWVWNFGDGFTSTEANPVHTYAAPGKYTVTLTVVNNAGSDTLVMKDYIIVNAKKQGTPGSKGSGEKPGNEGGKSGSSDHNEKPKIKLG